MERAPAGAVTAGAVAAGSKGLAVGAVGRYQAAVAVMAGRTGVVYFRIRIVGKRRRIVVTAGAVGRCNLDQRVMARGIDCMGGHPCRRVTGLTVAAGEEGLAVGAIGRHQAAVAVMAVRAVGQMRGRIDQRVGMTAGAVVRAGRGDQAAVIRGIGRMGGYPCSWMTGRAFAAASRDTWLQVRNGRMAEAAIIHMRSGHRRISGCTRIVTGQACSTDCHVVERHMVDIAVNGQVLVRVAI